MAEMAGQLPNALEDKRFQIFCFGNFGNLESGAARS
jgi:hypothetical protein